MSPISSRKIVPPVRAVEQSRLRALGVGERTLRVPEQLALQQRLGHRRAVDGHEGPAATVAPLVDRARDDLLAGAALAGDEHGGVGRRDALDQVVCLLHRGALPDEGVESRQPSRLQAQPLHLLAQAAVRRRPVDRDREDVELDRLVDEVVGAHADGSDRRVEAAERGEHDDGHVGAAAHDALAKLEAAEAAHVEIRHDDVEVLRVERPERLVRRRSRLDDEASLAEPESEGLAQRRVVIDQKDSRAHGDPGWGGRRRRSCRGRGGSRPRSSRRAPG